MKEINNQSRSVCDKKLKGCVLVVEDAVASRASIAKMLHSLRLYYQILDNNKQAVQAVTDASSMLVDNLYDMLLIKHPMPEMDGFEAARIIHESRKRHALPKLPIIILLEDGFAHDDKKECMVGVSACLYKPFTQEDFYQVLKDHLPALSCDVNGNGIATEIGTDIALLDQVALDELRALQKEGNPDILLRIITLYFTNAKKLAQSVEEAILTEDVDKLKVAAHTLKSSSAILGATGFSGLCGRLETIGKMGALDDDMDLVLNQFKYEYMAVKRALAAEYHRQMIQGHG